MTAESSTAEQVQSDYAKVGGGKAIAAVVERFYQLVLADERLGHFFTDTDMAGLKRHQTLLISQVMGGPAEYDGRELRDAHAGLDIAAGDFQAVAEHLVAALSEFDVPTEIIDRVVSAVGATQPDIVTGSTPAA